MITHYHYNTAESHCQY